MRLPEYVTACIEGLNRAGFEGYAVGGCVRDWLCGLTPKDYDVATSATPEQVAEAFPKVVPTGLKYGTVTVLLSNHPVEVTTFRKEEGYSDGRRPDRVHLIDSLTEDLARRDLTINAMAYSPASGLIDPFGGADDVRRGIIRAVGDPARRFEEDRLRILRAFRFAATLGYRLDPKTREAALKKAEGLSAVSAQRVTAELMRALVGRFPARLLPLIEGGGLLPWGIRPTASLAPLQATAPEKSVRLAALCRLTASEFEEVGERLCLDNRTQRETAVLLQEQARPIPLSERQIRLCLSQVEPPLAAMAFRLRGDLSLQDAPAAACVLQRMGRILRRGDPYRLHMLQVKGEDLMGQGVLPGPQMKRMLSFLLEEVLADPSLNQKETLLRLVQRKREETGL